MKKLVKESRLIPFSCMPGSWGLKGQTYAEAEARYYYTGESLDRRLAQIRFEEGSIEYEREILRVDHKYGHLDAHAYDLALLELSGLSDKEKAKRLIDINVAHGQMAPFEADVERASLDHPKDSLELELALAEVRFRHGMMSENEYEKEVATLKDEPWIKIVDHAIDPSKGVAGVYFEFDWNDQWIAFLQENGYHGRTATDIVDQWFSHICRAQGLNSSVDGNVIPFSAPI